MMTRSNTFFDDGQKTETRSKRRRFGRYENDVFTNCHQFQLADERRITTSEIHQTKLTNRSYLPVESSSPVIPCPMLYPYLTTFNEMSLESENTPC